MSIRIRIHIFVYYSSIYNNIYKVRILLSRAPYIAHCSLRRAHTARAAVPGLRPSQRRPSAGSTALRRAPSAGQCRPSAFGRHSVPLVQTSAGLASVSPMPRVTECTCRPVPHCRCRPSGLHQALVTYRV